MDHATESPPVQTLMRNESLLKKIRVLANQLKVPDKEQHILSPFDYLVCCYSDYLLSNQIL